MPTEKNLKSEKPKSHWHKLDHILYLAMFPSLFLDIIFVILRNWSGVEICSVSALILWLVVLFVDIMEDD